MPDANRRLSDSARRLRRCSGAALSIAAAGVLLVGGCSETDSYMDPSVIGRWERTPTIMPVLDRIAAIEDSTGDVVEYTEPTPEDLIPVGQQYRVGPGDILQVTAYDLVEVGRPELYEVTVDNRGSIEIPQLGRVAVTEMTTQEIEGALIALARRLVRDPLISVRAVQQRQMTFTLVGNVENPGPYLIPKPDYRLLDAVTVGGVFNEDIPEVYIIRQVPLSETFRGSTPTLPPREPVKPSTEPGRSIIDIIKDIAPEPKSPQTPPPSEAPKGPEGGAVLDLIDQIAPGTSPATAPATPPATTPTTTPTSTPPGAPGTLGRGWQPEDQPPVVDLPETRPAPNPAGGSAPETNPTSWVFLNGKWVQVSRTSAPGGPGTGLPAGDEMLVTQRIIRVPMKDLLSGRQAVNIVIRPGDVVRLPVPTSGLIYMSGQINRVGPISIPASGGMTLLRAVDSAGGLAGLAIPERVDLQRMIGRDRQATIRLDLRAIAEQTQPDLLLKPNDRINIGTNFWAVPLAVVRNGFRATYGFGFLMDRNFGNDVFGPPPVERSF